MKRLTTSLLLIFVMFLGSSASAQPEPNIQRMSENVYGMFVNFYHSLVVIGEEGVLITDPANASRATVLKSEIAKLTPLPVTTIVLSHEHYDHVGGTEVFPDAEIYAHKHTEAVFRLDVTGQAPKEIDHYVGDRTTLTFGTTQVELLHYGAADGVGMLAVHLPEEHVVFSADLYEVDELTTGMWLADSNFLGSRSVLNALVAFEPRFAITAHSADVQPKHLQLGADFYNDLFETVEGPVRQAMSEGFGELVTALTTLPKQVSLPKYKDFRNYDHLPAHVERMMFSIFHGG